MTDSQGKAGIGSMHTSDDSASVELGQNRSGGQISFKDYAIVACGTIAPELNYLKETGFLDAGRILYTKPGRHEVPRELESQLRDKLRVARKHADRIIVVYGGTFCYVDTGDPLRSIDSIIEDEGPGISRIAATHCVDMLASAQERDVIGEGKNVYWLTPGWIQYKQFVFQDWDRGKANENFPRHSGGAIVLDGIGYFDTLVEQSPETILELSDWMGIPITAASISLERFKGLLAERVVSDLEEQIAELEKALPPHSVKPSMMERLEELEEKLKNATL